MGSLKRAASSSSLTMSDPAVPVRATAAAVMGCGASSCSAMGSANAMVTAACRVQGEKASGVGAGGACNPVQLRSPLGGTCQCVSSQQSCKLR